MSRVITSKTIGSLRQEDIFPDWWKSAEIEVPLFGNQQLTITFTEFDPSRDRTFIDEADQALTNFLALTVEDRNAISALAYKNCLDFFEITGFDEEVVKMFQEIEEPMDWHLRVIEKGRLLALQDKNEVWQFIRPTEIYVTRRLYEEQDIYIQVACQCDWEEEHGLQLVFRQGKKLTRISEQDGHLTEADAYDKPDEEDELLSKF